MRKIVLPGAALAAACLAVPLSAPATPYWTTEDYLRHASPAAEGQPVSRPDPQARSLEAYSLIYEYLQICDFLAGMQESDPSSPDFGGMHEGESPNLWAIVETDNTQEAIRVWSTYAALSGDLETYRGNIAAAWVYTLNYPAYSEEGSDSDYYRVHNCGWALVAECRYREVYGDAAFLAYADSCAAYLRTHRLPYTGVSEYYTRLHPLVEGWAAGTLYDYGVEQSDSASVAHALDVGGDVRDWIQANPNRLNNTEVWAMSGGTALWGVCRSVFTADPVAGQAWLPVHLPYMDTWAGPGTWNCSWSVWYAHAWHAAAAVTQDSTCTGYALALVDTLLDFDSDNDGGIPATSTDPATMDQSWVSCYLDFMGLEALLNQAPALDVAALGFFLPDPDIPLAQNQPCEVKTLAASAGLQPFGEVTVTVGGAWSASAATFLDFADVDTVSLGLWSPSQTGMVQLTMSLTPGGAVAANDTASLWVEVLGWGQIAGSVCDQVSGAPLAADLYFYHDRFPGSQPLHTAATNPSTGQYQVAALEGAYRVVVDPQIPYTDREMDGVVVALGGAATVNFSLSPAPVILVDDDGGDDLEGYYTAPLAAAGYDAYSWNRYQCGPPAAADLALFSAVVWFTGNETSGTLDSAEQAAVEACLNAGGSLLLSGQNIAEDLAGDPFLAQVLGCSFTQPHSGQFMVQGVPGDPVTGNLSLLLAGAGGAGNQTSTDVIAPLAPAVAAMTYPALQAPAALRRETPGKLLYLAFGLEAATGLIGTSTREEFLDAALQWFGVPSAVGPGAGPQSAAALPLAYSLSLHPNPFNAGVQVTFSLPSAAQPDLAVYDLGGRRVAFLPLGPLPAGRHCVSFHPGARLSSGLYFFRLRGPGVSAVTSAALVK
ncbi:MAG: carboxypeptidase regulatory-like domain-containing protein [Candidatus Zixiibacteriota bacterium]|nr:MAG: carboxypeptidase regulatory-like domain-containing protein [candidate division Zixibacteria bacterium]